MAQLVVRDIPQNVKALLARRAKVNGRSMEEEVRKILHKAAWEKQKPPAKKGLGTQIAELFEGCGFEGPVPEMRGKARAAKFK